MSAAHGDSHGESIGAYLLDALPELERQAFERHVMGCGACRDELERLRPAVDALPRSVTPLDAPPTLRRSLMAEVGRDAAAAGRGERGPAGLMARARARFTPAVRRARPAIAWTSAAFLLFVGVVAGYGATQLLDGDEDLKYAAAVDDRRLVEGSGTLLVPGGEDRAVLSVHGVPPLPSRKAAEIYQLWLVRGNELIPSSLLSVGRDGSGSATVPEGIADADAVWVTREQVGGARAPTEKPVMRVELN